MCVGADCDGIGSSVGSLVPAAGHIFVNFCLVTVMSVHHLCISPSLRLLASERQRQRRPYKAFLSMSILRFLRPVQRLQWWLRLASKRPAVHDLYNFRGFLVTLSSPPKPPLLVVSEEAWCLCGRNSADPNTRTSFLKVCPVSVQPSPVVIARCVPQKVCSIRVFSILKLYIPCSQSHRHVCALRAAARRVRVLPVRVCRSRRGKETSAT